VVYWLSLAAAITRHTTPHRKFRQQTSQVAKLCCLAEWYDFAMANWYRRVDILNALLTGDRVTVPVHVKSWVFVAPVPKVTDFLQVSIVNAPAKM
jgi:hypothetical protein